MAIKQSDLRPDIVCPPHETGRSYDGGMLDITGAHRVEIQINQNLTGKVLWVNVDGICVLRICRITGHISKEHVK